MYRWGSRYTAVYYCTLLYSYVTGVMEDRQGHLGRRHASDSCFCNSSVACTVCICLLSDHSSLLTAVQCDVSFPFIGTTVFQRTFLPIKLSAIAGEMEEVITNHKR